MAIMHDGTVYFSNASAANPWARFGDHRKADAHRGRRPGRCASRRRQPSSTSQKSALPPLVLAAGLLVAALAALSVRYILISRLKSAHLAKSLALNAGIISSSAHLVIAIDAEYRIMIFNRAAEQALGYSSRKSSDAAPSRSSSMPANSRSARARCRPSSVDPIVPGPGDLHAHPAARRLRKARVDLHPQGRLAFPGERHHHAAARRRRHRSRVSSASSRTSPRAAKSIA